MSYIKAKGEEAAKAALEQKKDFSKSLVKFKDGVSYRVRFASSSDYINYDAVSFYGKITTTPVVEGNLYEKASKLLHDKAKRDNDEEVKTLANAIRPRERYMFAFYNLENGQPVVIDVTKKQAETIIKGIQKFAKKLDNLPFELTKSGSGQATSVSITPVIDLDDLSKDEKKHWEATAGKAIDEEIFNVLYMKNESEQLADLTVLGIDLNALEQEGKEDYGF